MFVRINVAPAISLIPVSKFAVTVTNRFLAHHHQWPKIFTVHYGFVGGGGVLMSDT
jgi:hypothetical protein